MSDIPGRGEDASGPTPRQRQSVGGSYAAQLRPAMQVMDGDGGFVGTVEAIEGDEIRLAAGPDGDPHRLLPLSLVDGIDGIDGNRVMLRSRGDNAFGVAAGN